MVYAAGFTLATTFADRELHVEAFERIHLTGNAQLNLVQHELRDETPRGWLDISISGAAQSLHDLVIESVDGVLYIDTSDEQLSDDLVIHLGVQTLKELVNEGRSRIAADGLHAASLILENHGAGFIDIRHLDVADLTVVNDGAASTTLSGSAQHQYVDLAGAAEYHALGLASQTTQVSVRGASQVELQVEELLDITATGGARVNYSGKPWVLQKLSGKGAIKQLDE
jgi:hypothetical protein